MNEKLGYMMNAIAGFVGCIRLCVEGGDSDSLCTLVLVWIQATVLVLILCPLAIIYVFGILMSGGISLWRLIEHDYADNFKTNSDGEASNLPPAMDTLYYLALIQGVLFCYRLIMRLGDKRLARKVTHNECDCTYVQVVSNYLRETRRGCEKDPSFAEGRNLITYAIDKICSNSPVDCISGVKTLYTSMCIVEGQGHQDFIVGQHMLVKHLVLYASSSGHVLQKLLEALNSTGLHETRTRTQAAKIVESLAFNIKLEQFPMGIHHISSLIEAFEEYSLVEPYVIDNRNDGYEQYAFSLPSPERQPDELYKELIVQGMRILRKLAVDESNCRAMSDTRDLISKIMAPVTSDILHNTTNDHGEWSDVVERSMEVMHQLTMAPGEIGVKLRHKISTCEKAINTLRRILSCTKCHSKVQERAIRIVNQLCKDTAENNRKCFVRMLLKIFMSNKSGSIRDYAGMALSEVCSRGRICDATIVIQTSGGDIVDGLAKVLVQDMNEKCRQKAAIILKHLCINYTMDDEYLGKLKKAISEAMTSVLGEIICCGGETQTGDNADLENQYQHVQDEENNKSQAIPQSIMSEKFLSSLLSLFVTVYDTMFISDLVPQLDASSFVKKLEEEVAKRSNNPTVENLLLYKAIGKMAISLMKPGSGKFVKQDLGSLIKALSSSSKKMLVLDYSMVFRPASIFETVTKLDGCTLASLLKEAQELHAMIPSTSMSD